MVVFLFVCLLRGEPAQQALRQPCTVVNFRKYMIISFFSHVFTMFTVSIYSIFYVTKKVQHIFKCIRHLKSKFLSF